MYESLSTGQNCLLSLILASDCGDLTVWAILRPYNIQYKISILLRLAKSNNFNGFVCRVWPWPKTSFSTHISLVTHICVNLLCIHWCTRWRGVLYVTSHYVNQCPVSQLIVAWWRLLWLGLATQIWVNTGSGAGLLPDVTNCKSFPVLNQCWLIICKIHSPGGNFTTNNPTTNN